MGSRTSYSLNINTCSWETVGPFCLNLKRYLLLFEYNVTHFVPQLFRYAKPFFEIYRKLYIKDRPFYGCFTQTQMWQIVSKLFSASCVQCNFSKYFSFSEKWRLKDFGIRHLDLKNLLYIKSKSHIFSEMNCVTFAVLSFQLWNATYAVFIADSVSDPFISGTDPRTSPVAGFVTKLNHWMTEQVYHITRWA